MFFLIPVPAFISKPNKLNLYFQLSMQFPLPECVFIALCQTQNISAWGKSSVEEGVNSDYTAQILTVSIFTPWVSLLIYLQSFFRKLRDTNIFQGTFIAPEKVAEMNFLLQASEGNSVHLLSGIAFGAANISMSLQ